MQQATTTRSKGCHQRDSEGKHLRGRAQRCGLAVVMALGVMPLADAVAPAAAAGENCGPGSANVADFRAGRTDVEAFNAAVAALPSGGILTVPAGRYVLNTYVMLNIDRLCVVGRPGAVLVSEAPPDVGPTDYINHSVFLVNKMRSADERDPVHNVSVRSLDIRVVRGVSGDKAMGIIQYNNCLGCSVENVTLVWDNPSETADQKEDDKSTDGIAFSSGATGTIRNVRVDGMPKGGIYLAAWSHHVLVENVTVTNSGARIGTQIVNGVEVPRYWGAGIKLTGSTNITVKNCRSDFNKRWGLYVAVNNFKGWQEARSSEISNCSFESNGDPNHAEAGGIQIGSAASTTSDNIVPEDIFLDHVNASRNDGTGLYIQAGRRIHVTAATTSENRDDGIQVCNVSDPRLAGYTADVEIAQSRSENNGQLDGAGLGSYSAALRLRAVDSVSVRDTVLLETEPDRIGNRLTLQPGRDGNHNGKVLLTGLDVADRMLTMPGGEADFGQYQLDGLGDPNTYRGVGLPAPPSSTYVDDRTPSIVYIKYTSAYSTTWQSS